MAAGATISNENAIREAFRQIEQEALPESKPVMAELIVKRTPDKYQAWAREKLLDLIGRMWPKPASPYQGFLFDEKELDRFLPLPKGKSVPYLDATLAQLKLSIPVSIRKAKKSTVKRLDLVLEKRQQLINEMTPYATHGSRSDPLTVRKFRQLVTDGVPPLPATSDRSASLRDAWAKRTPAERRAIARKRFATLKAKRKDQSPERAK